MFSDDYELAVFVYNRPDTLLQTDPAGTLGLQHDFVPGFKAYRGSSQPRLPAASLACQLRMTPQFLSHFSKLIVPGLKAFIVSNTPRIETT